MTVAVIGGGASGLMAALTAAGNGRSTVLFEGQPRVGRKLLATGNGRCNLTNLSDLTGHYHGDDSGFVSPAFERFSAQDTLAFFRSLGLITVTEPDGRVYPLSDASGSVLDVLRFACEGVGVEIRTDCQVTSIIIAKSGFKVKTEAQEQVFDRVIICCGGLAGGKLGGTKSGMELLKSFGHTTTKLYPALVQLKTDITYVKALKGVRADAGVRLYGGGRLLAESAGEVQFAEYGVSGPAIFEISRAASVTGTEKTLHIDLMRSFYEAEVFETLKTRRDAMPFLTCENLLTGMLQNRLGRTVVKYAGFDQNTPLSELSEENLKTISAAVKDFVLEVTGTLGFEGAQVTAGGVRTAEFDPKTLQSKLVPGLYAAGEVLDIDGDCGGYNLQWAWSSGHLAGLTL